MAWLVLLLPEVTREVDVLELVSEEVLSVVPWPCCVARGWS